MKTFFFIGLILFLGGIIGSFVVSRPGNMWSETAKQSTFYAIVIGFLFIGISSVLYLKKN